MRNLVQGNGGYLRSDTGLHITANLLYTPKTKERPFFLDISKLTDVLSLLFVKRKFTWFSTSTMAYTVLSLKP